MSEAIDLLQVRKRQVISTALGVNLVIGIFVGIWFPGLVDPATSQATLQELQAGPFSPVYQLQMLLFCFLWLGLDSRQLDIRRPWWLNVGVVLLTSIFISYYLYKTRPQNQRLRAILSFFGLLLAGAFFMSVGAYLAFAMSPNTSASMQPAAF